MKRFRLVAPFRRPTSNALAHFENIRLGVAVLCFAQFLPSQGLACSWDLNGVGYPASCGYHGRGGNVVQQPYVAPPPPPSPAEIAAGQATQINNDAVVLEKKGNWTEAVRLLRKALRINPNDGLIASNLAGALNGAAVAFNDRAMVAQRAGNYSLAASLYEEALQLAPHDHANYKTIADNLAWARGLQQAERDEQEQRRKDEAVAADMSQATQNLADSFKAASPSSAGSSNLDFLSGGTTPMGRNASGQDTSTGNNASNKGTGTPLFGAKGNPANLDFVAIDMGSDASKPVTVPVKSNIDALGSAAQSGVGANRPGMSEEKAKAKSNCVFDQAACAEYQSIDASKVRAIGQSPGAAALSAHIPDPAKSDRQIQQSFAYYEKLDGVKIERQAKLATVEQRIKNKDGDAGALDAERSQLNFDLKQADESQKNITKQIKEHLIVINTPWVEDPSPTPATGPAAGPKANQ